MYMDVQSHCSTILKNGFKVLFRSLTSYNYCDTLASTHLQEWKYFKSKSFECMHELYACDYGMAKISFKLSCIAVPISPEQEHIAFISTEINSHHSRDVAI